MTYSSERNSEILTNNTQQMATLAKATEQSGQEIHDMTERMESDARHMRFLAEITAFFLPLTALAVSVVTDPHCSSRLLMQLRSQTFFSMDFLSLTDDPTRSVLPTMKNAKFLWVYFLALMAMSLLVFGWWYYKHLKIMKTGSTEMDSIESKMEIQAQRDKSRRVQYATAKLQEFRQQWTEYQARVAAGADEDLPFMRDIVRKMYCAKTAIETGEDYEALYAGQSTT
jgi:hypothetical protein